MEFNISLNTENTHIRVKDIKRVLNTVLDEIQERFREDAILNFSDARYDYTVNGKSLEVENIEGEKVDIGPVNVKITINPQYPYYPTDYYKNTYSDNSTTETSISDK